MNLIERLKQMLGFNNKQQANFIGPDVSRAVQRNEAAQENARRALEELKSKGGMADTMREIAGKMK